VTEYSSIPYSDFYSCKKCNSRLKLWPMNKLSRSRCSKCKTKIENDGTNLHVCFTCPKDISEKNHLCSGHHAQGQGLVLVDFDDLENFGVEAQQYNLFSNVHTIPETKEGSIEYPPPPPYEYSTNKSWNERITEGAEAIKTQPRRMFRQTSVEMGNAGRGFRRMVSIGDGQPNTQEYNPLMPYPVQPGPVGESNLPSTTPTAPPAVPSTDPPSVPPPTYDQSFTDPCGAIPSVPSLPYSTQPHTDTEVSISLPYPVHPPTAPNTGAWRNPENV